jgi:hypothetical protein
LVLIFAIAGEFYVIHLMDSYKPTQRLLTQPKDVSAEYVEANHGKGGLVPMLNGMRLACGVSYRGVTRPCLRALPTLQAGTHLTASVVEFSTLTGPILVPISMHLGDGSIYQTSPDEIMSAWKSDSYNDLIRLPIYVLVIFIGLPIFFKFIVKA